MFIKLDGQPEVYLDLEDRCIVEYYSFTSDGKQGLFHIGQNKVPVSKFHLEMKKLNENVFKQIVLHIDGIKKDVLNSILSFYNVDPKEYEEKDSYDVFFVMKEFYLDKLVVDKSKKEKSIFNKIDAENKVVVLDLNNYTLDEVV